MFISTKTQLFQLPFPAVGVTTCLSIWPNSALNRGWWRANDGADLAYFLIEADPSSGTAPPISTFSLATLSRIFAAASLTVIWSGDVPHDQKGFVERIMRRGHRGAKIAIVLCRTEDHAAWLAQAVAHCRADAEVFQIKERPPGLSPEDFLKEVRTPRPARTTS
jgi:hypothetical protein